MNSHLPPPVSVVMTAHNEENYVGEAVQSLLIQTFSDFELIVVDDASTDATSARLREFSDPRIKAIHNTSCLGLTRSLLVGMNAVRGSLVARLDADDLAEPHRLELQVAAFRANPALGLLGSQAHCIDAGGRRRGSRRVPTTDLAIRWCSLLDNPFLHSAVMFRTDLYEKAGGYNPDFATAQDYDLWRRMLPLAEVANLPGKLISYRTRPGAITERRRKQQLDNHDRVSNAILADGGFHEIALKALQPSLRALFAGGIGDVEKREIPDLINVYLDLLVRFHAQHRTLPGWTPLLIRERLRCLRRLSCAPNDVNVWKARILLLSPLFICGKH